MEGYRERKPVGNEGFENAGIMSKKKTCFSIMLRDLKYSIPYGFTLLELLVVLIIISLMSVLVVPQFAGSLARMNLQTASKKISASLRYARSQAASEKIIYVAIFNFEKDRLSIMSGEKASDLPVLDRTQTGESIAIEEDLSDGEKPVIRSRSYDLPDGIKLEKGVSGEGEIDSGLFEIVFFPTGSSSGGDVILVNDQGKRYKISVDFITGGVRLGELDEPA